MKYFISTGEISGDLHISYIIKEIIKSDKEAVFFGVAGKHSEKNGLKIIQDIKDLAIMGFTQILFKYKFLKEKEREYLNFIKENNIEKVILVDYGGFNLRFLEDIKKEFPKIKVYYYIPPKLWVWGEKRIEKLKLADYIIVIFPWEVEFYKKHGINAIYYGNPFHEKYEFIKERGNKILLLPGSRKQEVKSLIKDFIKLAKEKTEEKFLLKLAKKEHFSWIEKTKIDKIKNIEVNYDLSLEEAVKKSKFAIAASGTVTLELALMGIPAIVVYKASIINEIIVKVFLKHIKYVSLPNITLDKEVFKELLQRECNFKNLINEINSLEKNKFEIEKNINLIREKLSGKNIIKSYADFISKGN